MITRAGHEPVVIVSLADFESLRETAYLMRSPTNARRLLDAIGAARERPGRCARSDRRRLTMLLVWDRNGWDDYVWWQTQDRKVLQRINLLIEDVVRNGNEGLGKPEPLKYDSPATGRVGSPMSTASSTS